AQGRSVVVENGEQTARGPQRKKQQPQQRRLAGARRPGQELERLRLDFEVEVAQHLRPQAIPQSRILESDHTVFLSGPPKRLVPPQDSGPVMMPAVLTRH